MQKLKGYWKYLLAIGVLLIGVVCFTLFSPAPGDYVVTAWEEGKEIKGNLLSEPLVFEGERCKVTLYQVVAYEQYIYTAYTLDTKEEEENYRLDTEISLKSGEVLPEKTLIMAGDEKYRIEVFAFDSDLKAFLDMPFVFHAWYMEIEDDFSQNHDFDFTLKELQEAKIYREEATFKGIDGFQLKVQDNFLIGNMLLISFDVEPEPEFGKDTLAPYLECEVNNKKYEMGGFYHVDRNYPLQKGKNSTEFLIPIKSISNPVLKGVQYKMEKPKDTIYMEGEYKLQNF